jgi:putative oligomerization/nucleic acid binding protein
MSTTAGVLVHPVNGHEVEVYRGFSWPCLFLGFFWYGFKGMWGWAVIGVVAALLTYGMAWLFFPFFANAQHLTYLEKQGYLTAGQARERQPLGGRESRLSPAPLAAPGSVAEELRKLAGLRDSGVLTEVEFQEQKRRILA